MTEKVTILLLCALLGTFFNWVNARKNGVVTGGPLDYLLHKPWHSLSAFGAAFSGCGLVIISGQLATADPWVAAALGFGAGYVSDSLINRGPRT